MSYSAYTPFRINSNKCSECPEKVIITDNKNDYLKTKKDKCAFALKFGLYNKRNPFRRYTGISSSTNSSICSSNKPIYNENLDEISSRPTQSLSKNNCNSKTSTNKPIINAFGRFEGNPYGSGSRIVNRF